MKTLTLIVPRLDPRSAWEGTTAAQRSRWPTLARLAGRGAVTARIADSRFDSLQGAVLESLGLRDAAEAYPSAATMLAGASGERPAGFWLRAQPIHFAAGLDRITTVVLKGDARMSAMERTTLAPLLAGHLQSSGLELHHASEDEWLLRSAQPLQVQTVTAEFAAANPRAEILPRGRDAGGLRRLMTELQMLLHEHPVNASRQARGVPVINAIWIHGEGQLAEVKSVPLPDAAGDDPYLRGIYLLHGKAVLAKPAGAATLLSQVQASSVAIVDSTDVDTLESQWLVPLSRALFTGALSKFTLLLDEWRVTIERTASFKLWRRDLPPTDWPPTDWPPTDEAVC